MIKFLIKGIIRDKSRSLFPLTVIILTVSIIIFTLGFIQGTFNSIFKDTAILFTGHQKIVTIAYNEESQMLPNDLAILDVNQTIDILNNQYPDYFWTPRITFAGLLDIPDENRETINQGPVLAKGLDLLNQNSRQTEIWELNKNLIYGELPSSSDEALISMKLATKLNVSINDTVTFIGNTMYNAFTTYNFIIVGIFDLRKGQADSQMLLVDISGAQKALDMQNAASEILGYSHTLYYDDDHATSIRTKFNNINSDTTNIFSPIMLALRDSNDQLGTMVDISASFLIIFGAIFLIIVMIVLWNLGLMTGLRRYGEIGLRLAMGETKGQVYRSMVYESIIIGLIGTIIGTIFGISITYYVQENGIDYSKVVEKMSLNSMAFPNIIYAKITPSMYYIGLIPGVIATALGTMLAGLAIYKREMTQLFKELET